MIVHAYKYQGAGNDFVIFDNRNNEYDLTPEQIKLLCDRRFGIGADGMMLLGKSEEYDFSMRYFNADGYEGSMCGNGGRCIVAFAADRGIGHFDFDAADGFHSANIVKDDSGVKTVRLKMTDVRGMLRYQKLAGVTVPSEGYFLDTGTRHYVRFVDSLDSYDIVSEGRNIRTKAHELGPIGANVNFVEPVSEGVIKVRTYEKGVEDETFACGTGIVASAMASYVHGVRPRVSEGENGRLNAMYTVHAKRDILAVSFDASSDAEWSAKNVWLTGPAAFIAEINI